MGRSVSLFSEASAPADEASVDDSVASVDLGAQPANDAAAAVAPRHPRPIKLLRERLSFMTLSFAWSPSSGYRGVRYTAERYFLRARPSDHRPVAAGMGKAIEWEGSCHLTKWPKVVAKASTKK